MAAEPLKFVDQPKFVLTQGERYMMMILLPHKRYGLADVEKRLDTKFLATAYLHLKTETDVSLKLPRFSHRSTVDIHAICDKVILFDFFRNIMSC